MGIGNVGKCCRCHCAFRPELGSGSLFVFMIFFSSSFVNRVKYVVLGERVVKECPIPML